MYRDIMAGKNQVKLADEQTSVAAFNDVGELEGHFRSLQVIFKYSGNVSIYLFV